MSIPSTKDPGVLSVTENRVWYARSKIESAMTTFGLKVPMDGDVALIRGADCAVRWLVLSSDESIRALFDNADVDRAAELFSAMAGKVDVQHIEPAGITFRGANPTIDGAAMLVSIDDGPQAQVIPIGREVTMNGSEWVETVVMTPRSEVAKWKRLLDAANSADRVIDSASMVMRVVNGPDIKIQRIKIEDIIMETDVLLNFVNDLTGFLSRRQWYAERGLPWSRKFLLDGPPGVGKTSLMRWAATNLGLPSFTIDFTDEYARGSHLNRMLQIASDKAPALVILDDIDKILGGQNSTRISIHSLQTALSGMGSLDGVIVIATSNSPVGILGRMADGSENPLARRFDSVISVPLPSGELRVQYLKKLLSKDILNEGPILQAADLTDGWSYSDLKSAVTSAANTAVASGSNFIRPSDLIAGVNSVARKKRDQVAGSMRSNPEDD